MLKKNVTYLDFEGNERTDTFYFNLTKAELVQMELSGEGNSLAESMRRISESNNGKKIIETMKKIIGQAYGERSEDGKFFRKSEQITADFESTAAYSELWMELATNAGKSAEFINAIVPANMGSATDAAADAQSARQRSEAQMQGHKPKQVTTQQVVPDLPEEPEAAKPLTDEEIDSLNVPESVKARLRQG